MREGKPTILGVTFSLIYNYVVYVICLFLSISGAFMLSRQEWLWGLVCIVLPIATYHSLKQNTKDLHRIRKHLIHQNKHNS